MTMVKAIGNGQVHQLYLQDKAGALNCMADQQKVMIGRGMNNDLPEQVKGGDVKMGASTVRRLTPM